MDLYHRVGFFNLVIILSMVDDFLKDLYDLINKFKDKGE